MNKTIGEIRHGHNVHLKRARQNTAAVKPPQLPPLLLLSIQSPNAPLSPKPSCETSNILGSFAMHSVILLTNDCRIYHEL